MALIISAKVATPAFDIKELKKELKYFFKSQKKLIEKPADRGIEILNITLSNDFICSFSTEEGTRIIDNDSKIAINKDITIKEKDSKDDAVYKYKLSIDFMLDDSTEKKAKGILGKSRNIQNFLEYLSKKYQCKILVHSAGLYAYVLKNGDLVENIIGTRTNIFSKRKKYLELKWNDQSIKMLFSIWSIVIFLALTIYLFSLYNKPATSQKLLVLTLAIFFLIFTIVSIILLVRSLNRGKCYLDIDSSGIYNSAKTYSVFIPWEQLQSVAFKNKIYKIDEQKNIKEIDLKKDNSKYVSNLDNNNYDEYIYLKNISEFSKEDVFVLVSDTGDYYIKGFNYTKLPEKIVEIWKENIK